jgi:hypothetical protein
MREPIPCRDGRIGGTFLMNASKSLRRRLIAVLAAITLALLAATVASNSASAATKGWKWAKGFHVKHLQPLDNGLACPKIKLCIAIGDNRVLWSTNPTKKSSWHSAALEPSSSPDVSGTIGFDGLSCPTANFCAAVDDIGNVFTTSNPTGGKAAWHGAEIDNIELLQVGCSGPHLCAALDYYGNALTSTAPLSGVWHSAHLTDHSGAAFYGVSCAGSSLCVGVEASGTIYRTTNPGAATPKWHKSHATGSWNSVACPTAHKCVAFGGHKGKGAIAVSSNPGAGPWKAVTLKEDNFGFNVGICHGTGFCFALSDYWSANPKASRSVWHTTTLPGAYSQVEIACPTNKMCLIGDIRGDLTVGHRH